MPFWSCEVSLEIIWKRSSAHSDTKQGRKQHGRIHDVLLFYTKGEHWTWNPIYTRYDEEYKRQFYKYVEEGRDEAIGLATYRAGWSGEGQSSLRSDGGYAILALQPSTNGKTHSSRACCTDPARCSSSIQTISDEMPGRPIARRVVDINPIASQGRSVSAIQPRSRRPCWSASSRPAAMKAT